MASVIFLNIGEQKAFRDRPIIRSMFTNPDDDYITPIISKGNIIEEIEARY